jgi:hypothetical protein
MEKNCSDFKVKTDWKAGDFLLAAQWDYEETDPVGRSGIYRKTSSMASRSRRFSGSDLTATRK